jgi:hypothetical protein
MMDLRIHLPMSTAEKVSRARKYLKNKKRLRKRRLKRVSRSIVNLHQLAWMLRS